MKRALVLIVAFVSLAGGLLQAAPAAKNKPAARNLLVGIYDEAETLGHPERAFPQLDTLGVKTLRANLYWGGRDGVASQKRPAQATDPDDPAYNWFAYDRMVKLAAEHDIKVVFAITATPRWANGGKPPNRAPSRGLDLRKFAQAAATRYSGTFIPASESGNEAAEPLPAVRYWLAWSEPNNPVFLSPQYQRTKKGVYLKVAAKKYAGICNAIVVGIHAANRLTGEKIACGVTAPRGNNNPRSRRASISPKSFIRQMKRFGAKGFDAYAHHPYYTHRLETPTTRPNIVKGPRIEGGPITLANIDELIAEVNRLYGRKPIWITEYGFQTKPDRDFAVSYQQQARYLKQAFAIARRNPRIQMMLWFLLRDEPGLERWQSGLLTLGGKRKPAFRAFQLVPK